MANPFDQFDAQPGGIIPVPTDPFKAAANARAERADQRANAELGLKQQQFKLTQQQAQMKQSAPPLTAKQRSDLQDSLTTLNQFQNDLLHLQKTYNQHFAGGGIGALREYLPEAVSPINQDYNSTGRRLLPLVAKALGFTSKQMDTPTELKRLESYIPLSTDRDLTAQHKIRDLGAMLRAQRANINQQLGIKSPLAPKSAPQNKVIDFKDLP